MEAGLENIYLCDRPTHRVVMATILIFEFGNYKLDSIVIPDHGCAITCICQHGVPWRKYHLLSIISSSYVLRLGRHAVAHKA